MRWTFSLSRSLFSRCSWSMVVKDFSALAAAVARTTVVRMTLTLDECSISVYFCCCCWSPSRKESENSIQYTITKFSHVMSIEIQSVESDGVWGDGRTTNGCGKKEENFHFLFLLSLSRSVHTAIEIRVDPKKKKRSPFSQHDVHCQLYSNKKIYHQHIFLALLVNYRNNLTSCHRHPQEVAAFSPLPPTHRTRLITVPSKYLLSQAR